MNKQLTILILLGLALAAGSIAYAFRPAAAPPAALAPAGDWATDAIWYDGLVEKATYDAEKILYGQPRQFTSTILTNKEQHDRATWTKARGSQSTVEVWKHNKIEVVPTPNYDYKFITTSHYDVNDLGLTRFDLTSQEWCGTSVKQYQRQDQTRGSGTSFDYWSFSYMPEEGRQAGAVEAGDLPVVPANGLSMYLRGYDFAKGEPLELKLLPDQKSNRATPWQPVDATVTLAGQDEASYTLAVEAGGQIFGTFTFAKDRQHVMLSAELANGDKYTLVSQERVNYWTIQ